MIIPAGVIIPFDGNHADIPSGFTRETKLDGKFPKGWGSSTAPDVSGGSDGHTHTSPSHTHTIASHSHLVVTSDAQNASWVGSANGNTPNQQHIHSENIAGVSAASISGATTFASGSSLPPFYEVIFIKPTSGALIPPKGMVYWNETADPIYQSLKVCDGENDTPNLTDKYLRGAAASGNAGGLGGVLNHTHAINHSHSAVSHTHSANMSSGANYSGQSDYGTGDGSSKSQPGHYHPIVLSSSSDTPGEYTGEAGSAETVEPPYKKTKIYKNISENGCPIPLKGIFIFIGDVANIPPNFVLCDGNNGTPDWRDKFIKITNTDDDIGDTGGSATHTHAASGSHGHTASSVHSHSVGSFGNAQGFTGGSPSGSSAIREHTHNVSSVGNATTTWNPVTVTADSSNNEPAFLTVAYIQLNKMISGGAHILSMMI